MNIKSKKMKKYLLILILSLIFVNGINAQNQLFPEYSMSDFNVAFNLRRMGVHVKDSEEHYMCDSLLYYELHQGMAPVNGHRWIQPMGGMNNAYETNTPPALMCRLIDLFASDDFNLNALLQLYPESEQYRMWVQYQDTLMRRFWQEEVGDVIKGDWLVSYTVDNEVQAMVALYNADSMKYVQPISMLLEDGQWKLSANLDSTAVSGNFWVYFSNNLDKTDLVVSNDFDGDGILNYDDNCPCTSNVDQIDTDGDGYGDGCDLCPETHSTYQYDRDHDGIGDECDICPENPDPEQLDSDGDGVGDACDVCPQVWDPDQYITYDEEGNVFGLACDPDIDHDGIPNEEDDDMDGDGWPNEYDNCPRRYNPRQTDSDGDGVGDVCDNCQLNFNPDQSDINRNGIGDVCDEDIDGDGIPNDLDICPYAYDPDQEDEDCNGIGDVCQDLDEDGILDIEDNCPEAYNPDQADENHNGVGDVCEEDEE